MAQGNGPVRVVAVRIRPPVIDRARHAREEIAVRGIRVEAEESCDAAHVGFSGVCLSIYRTEEAPILTPSIGVC
jgi:hypothetical protein